MPGTLDRQMDAAVAALTAAGGAMAGAGPAGHFVPDALPTTLPEFFRTFCARHADREALVAGTERLTFAEIDALSDRAAAALAGEFGVRSGDRVAIAMRNAPAWIVCYMAVLKAGGIATLINARWVADELAAAIRLTEPVLILADSDRAGRIRRIDPHVDARIIELAVDAPIAEALASVMTAASGPLPQVDAVDDATILFTSGSTGAARGAVSTHRAVTAAAYTLRMQSLALRDVLIAAGMPPPAPATLIAVPLFHVTGMVSVLLNSIALGRKMICMPRWDAGEALRLIEAERVTYFVGVPTMSLEMMQHPDRAIRDLGSLAEIVAGGAPRPIAHVPRLRAAFPAANPMMGYGLTETNAVGCSNLRASYLARPASTGRAHRPFVDVIVIGADDRPAATGESGEIAIRSKANARGYWRDDVATAAAFTAGGHLRTGDMGYLDADGYLFIIDRAKDIILRGGENVGCQEVEAALYAHPDIREACVFALPESRLGEVPGAVVHAAPGCGIDADGIAAFLRDRIARYKQPVWIWFVDRPLPKLGSGKIDRRALRAMYSADDPANGG